MGHNKSATKGSSFERLLCRQWSLWWTGGSRDDIFWRTSGSGSRATSRRKTGKKDKWNHGDMRPDDPRGFALCSSWCFEFKFYQRYDIKGVLHHVSGKSDWLQWWAKITDEAQSVGRAPILITKQNAGVPIIWFRTIEWNLLKIVTWRLQQLSNIRLRIIKQKVRVLLQGQKKKSKTIHLKTHSVFGITIDDFFSSVDPGVLKALVLDREMSV